MAEKIKCPKCKGFAYTASPQVKSRCPYCDWDYNEMNPLYPSPFKRLKQQVIYSFQSHDKDSPKT
jgi:tRNA G26 N,N-dimethylase Trm1